MVRDVGSIIEELKNLSRDDRLEIFWVFCTECGCVQDNSGWNRCQCSNDD